LIVGIGARIKVNQGYRIMDLGDSPELRQSNGMIAAHHYGNHSGLNQGEKFRFDSRLGFFNVASIYCQSIASAPKGGLNQLYHSIVGNVIVRFG